MFPGKINENVINLERLKKVKPIIVINLFEYKKNCSAYNKFEFNSKSYC